MPVVSFFERKGFLRELRGYKMHSAAEACISVEDMRGMRGPHLQTEVRPSFRVAPRSSARARKVASLHLLGGCIVHSAAHGASCSVSDSR